MFILQDDTDREQERIGENGDAFDLNADSLSGKLLDDLNKAFSPEAKAPKLGFRTMIGPEKV